MHRLEGRSRDAFAPGHDATAGHTRLWLPLGALCLPLLLFLFPAASGGDRPRLEPADHVGQEPPAPAGLTSVAPRPATPPASRRRALADGAGSANATFAGGSAIRGEATPQPDRANESDLVVRVTDEHGRPVPLASLELRHTAQDGTDQLTSVTTDAGGRHATRLPAGDVCVTAWSHAGTGGPLQATLRQGGDEELRVVLVLSRTVSGVVLDAATGAPVADARVSFWTFAETDRVTTAADGTFVHPRFPAGHHAHQVRIEAPGYGASVRYLEFPERDTWSLAAAHDGGTEAAGRGLPWLELSLTPELVVSGRVTDADGAPLSGAEVRAEGYFRILPSVASLDEAACLTDEDGRFSLDGLRSDIGHAVRVTSTGYAGRVVELAADGATERRLDTLVLRPDRALAGVVLDPSGNPVPDIAVELRPEGETLVTTAATSGPLDVAVRVDSRVRTARTDPQGHFVFAGLEASSYRLVVVRDRGALADTFVNPADAALRDGLVVRLPASTLTLEGEVRDELGPVAGAEVEVRRHGLVGRVATNASGRFRVAGLDDEAAYEIVASAPCPRTGSARTGRVDVWGYAHADLRLAVARKGR